MVATGGTIVRSVLGWPVASQQVARRNALVAATALAQRRAERDEVEDFLEAHGRRRAAAAGHRTGQRAGRRTGEHVQRQPSAQVI